MYTCPQICEIRGLGLLHWKLSCKASCRWPHSLWSLPARGGTHFPTPRRWADLVTGINNRAGVTSKSWPWEAWCTASPPTGMLLPYIQSGLAASLGETQPPMQDPSGLSPTYKWAHTHSGSRDDPSPNRQSAKSWGNPWRLFKVTICWGGLFGSSCINRNTGNVPRWSSG